MILLRYGNTNTYYTDGLLIDTDMPGTLPLFYKELKKNGLNVGDIRFVLATHWHPDHMGLIGELTALGVKLILETIRAKQPQATGLLLPVFPRGQKPTDKMRLNNAKISSLIRPFADGKDVIWLDFTDKYLQADGTISKDLMPDFLHPKEPGYDIWADAVAPYFREAVGR